MTIVGTPDFTQGTRNAELILNTVRTGYVRPVDMSLIPPDKMFSQLLYLSDVAIVLLSGNTPDGLGPAPHRHSSDQFFYMIEGSIELTMGQETFELRKGDFAFIPAGTPHKHRNLSSTERELHLEILAPGISLTDPFLIMVEPGDAWAGGGKVAHQPPLEQWRTGRSSKLFVLSEPAGRLTPAIPESDNVTCWVARSEPGQALNPNLHIHEFTQFYYVLEGALAVDVALQHHEVGPHTLVVLPTGAPHRNYVVGDVTESHVQFNVPGPTGDAPWDIPVSFEAKQDGRTSR